MANVILTGATGYVGSYVLQTLINDSRVLSVLVLSRRPLPPSSSKTSPKVTVLIHKDFSTYPAETIEKLRGFDACIWCIGGMVRDFKSVDEARKVQVGFAVKGAEAIKAAMSEGGQMKFVFCSGAWAERDQKRTLRMLSDTRKIKGEAENGLLEVAESTQGFEVFCMRLGGVLPASIPGALSMGPVIKVDQVAKVFVDVAIHGASKNTFENHDMMKYKFDK